MTRLSYELEVRSAEAPHEVLGRLSAPYEATIGKQPVVRFECRRRFTDRTVSLVDIEVNLFADGRTGNRFFAFKVKREDWPTLRAAIA